jgi:hypothetical protein
MMLASAAVATSAAAQNQPGPRLGSSSPPTVVAVPAGSVSPTVDGKLDELAWRMATVATDFTQLRPNDGATPTERTEVRILYASDALYLAVRLFDSDPGGITGQLTRRDTFTPSDAFWVDIDSYHDHRTSFQLGVNAAGVRWDGVASNDNGNADLSWDPVWSAATDVDSLGWVLEMRIPFSQLRFSGDGEQVWGINFSRDINRKNERTRWAWKPNEEAGYASRFGHLEGLRDLPQPRRLEVLPYTVAKSDLTEGADPANPFNDGSVYSLTGGFDLKYGLTSDLTLDATVNPDFGQVEADPAVVNLTAFETFFEERRPFFVEGSNLFQFGSGSGGIIFGSPRLFYSRRIGREPSRSADDPDGYVDNPIAARILGAAKLSGQTAGWSVGVLNAITNRESARIEQQDGTRATERVEPLANFSVLSLRRDLRDGSSGVGFMATGVNRRLDDPLFSSLTSSAYSGGVDFFHRFGDNQFAVNGTFSGSRTRGDSTAIIAAQRSSARYYQRPDQDYVSVDSSATALSGFAASVQAGKVAGNWLYGTDIYAYSPGFEINDAGFQTQTDHIFHGVRVSRRWLDPGPVFRTFSVDATWAQIWNFGGLLQAREAYFGFGGQFLNYWNFHLESTYNFSAFSSDATRGGPSMQRPKVWSASGSAATDYRKPVSVVGFGNYARNDEGGYVMGGGGHFNIRPSSALSLTLAPRYDKTHAMGFYVTQQVDPTAIATYGSRYVFSELIQTSLDLTLRMDLALTPDLSVQLYAQPFVAAADYQGFKEFAEPRTFEFLRYGVDGASTLSLDQESNVYTADSDGAGPALSIEFDNPDFRYRSLRSNLVLRWEYLPGSTLFLVWNHGQSGDASDPTFRLFGVLGDLLRDDQQNTFAVKLNYWLSL